MSPFARQRMIAASFAVLATFGLVLAPVLHAELHASEADEEHEESLGRDHDRESAGDEHPALPELEANHDHDHGHEHHHHSHGPGSHGAGSLEHLALAVHVAPAVPAVALPERVPDAPVLPPVASHLTPRYLVPDFSQGPPRG